MGFIYKLIDPRTNLIRYVGQTTTSLKQRLKKHLSDSIRINTHVCLWIRNLINVNLEPVMECIEEVDNQYLDEREIYYIRIFRGLGFDLTNIMNGGRGKGAISEETKNKISQSLKGHIQSVETKEKRSKSIREANKNPQLKEKQREHWKKLKELGKISQKGIPSPKKGKPFSGDKNKLSTSLKKFYSDNPEKRDENSKLLSGKLFVVYKVKIIKRGNRFVKQSTYEYGEFVLEHFNISKVSEMLGIIPQNVSKCLKRKRGAVNGYTFIYKENLQCCLVKNV